MANTAIEPGQIQPSSLVDANMAPTAAIAFSKLAPLPSGNILVGSAGNVAVASPISGDISLSNAGASSVLAVRGIAISATAPTTNQVLTATSPTAAAWVTPAAGGGGGYATVAVAAASGVAATDTANINAAISTASAAGGGTVILREGIYLINATLTIASRVTIRGQGKGIFGTGSATTIKCDNAMTNTLPLISNTTADDFGIEDLNIDFNLAGRGAGSGTDFTVQGLRFHMARVSMFNTRSQGGVAINLISNNINEQATRYFHQCDFSMGTSTVTFMQASGLFTECYFEGLTASGGLTNALCNFQSATVIGCRFRTTTSYTVATITLGNIGGTGAEPSTVSGCIFEQPSGTATRAIRVSNTGNLSATITGNVAISTNCGSIDVQAGVTAPVTITGNAGFSSYTNPGTGTAAANDAQTFNGITVSTTAPATGQVLTATSATAAGWGAAPGWVIASSQTLSVAASSITFSGLNLQADRMYKILISASFLPGPSTLGDTFRIRFNGDAVDTNYTGSIIGFSFGASLSSSPTTKNFLDGNVTFDKVIEVLVTSSPNNQTFADFSGTSFGIGSFLKGGLNWNSTVNVTSIVFATDSGTATAKIGTKIIIMKPSV